MRLYTEREIEDDLAYVGIRAHFVEEEPVTDANRAKADECNYAILKVDHLFEQQFESELVFDCGADQEGKDEGHGMLRILMDKERARELASHPELLVHIPDEAVLLLRK